MRLDVRDVALFCKVRENFLTEDHYVWHQAAQDFMVSLVSRFVTSLSRALHSKLTGSFILTDRDLG